MSEAIRLADALRDGTYLLSQERNATEAELRRLDAEIERLRGIVPEVLERLNDDLCAENETLRHLNANQAQMIATYLSDIARDQAELAEWRKLRDPVSLHVNLLRGQPARLDSALYLHIGGHDQLMAAERERWTAICRDHAADTEQPRKPFDSYEEGWVDACNEIMWEGRQEPQAKCTRLRQFLETIRDTGMTAEDAAEHAAAALRPNKETKHE